MTSGSFNGNKGLRNEITKIIINKIPPNKASLFLEINLKKLIILSLDLNIFVTNQLRY